MRGSERVRATSESERAAKEEESREQHVGLARERTQTRHISRRFAHAPKQWTGKTCRECWGKREKEGEKKTGNHRDANSYVASAISMASWLVGKYGAMELYSNGAVGVPQVFENWRNKNADGIAVSFLLIWLVGDTLSFIGGVLGRLIGTVILISCYFLVSDCVILSQTLYYQRYSRHARHHHRHHHHHHHPHAEQQESDALLPRRNSTTSVRQHRHRLTRMQRVLLQNLLCVVLVVVFGLVGFFVSKLQRGSSGGAGSPTAVTVASHGDITSVVSEVLGYASAVLYRKTTTYRASLTPQFWLECRRFSKTIGKSRPRVCIYGIAQAS